MIFPSLWHGQMHITLSVQSLQRLSASQFLSKFIRNSSSPRQQCRQPYSPWAVGCLPCSLPANKEYEAFTQSNTDTPGAHPAQTMHFLALCGGAVELGSSIYHPSPLCSSCSCNQELDILNSHNCLSFSYKSCCSLSALTCSYYSPPEDMVQIFTWEIA